MLVLSRKTRETIQISDNISVTILRIQGSSVRIGIDAPRHIRIVRGEIPLFDDENVPTRQEEVSLSADDDDSPEEAKSEKPHETGDWNTLSPAIPW